MADTKKTLRFEFLADTKKFLGKVGAVGKKFDALGQDMNRVGGQINKVFAGIGLAAGAVATAPAGAGGGTGQPRAGRGLPVHEADHLVAAGLAGADLQLGRAGRLGDAGGRELGRGPGGLSRLCAVDRRL